MSYASSRPNDRLTVGTYTASTTAGQVFASAISCYTIQFQSDPNNTVDVYMGNAQAQPIHLLPGQTAEIDTNNITNFYAITSSSTALINWWASG